MQLRFILGTRKKCTIPVSDFDNGGGYACVRAQGIWENYVPSLQLCCKSKTALKYKDIKNKFNPQFSHDDSPHYRFQNKIKQNKISCL